MLTFVYFSCLLASSAAPQPPSIPALTGSVPMFDTPQPPAPASPDALKVELERAQAELKKKLQALTIEQQTLALYPGAQVERYPIRSYRCDRSGVVDGGVLQGALTI